MNIVTAKQKSVRAGCEHVADSSETGDSHPSLGWQSEVKNAVRSVDDLAEVLQLEISALPSQVEESFATFVPRAYLRRIQPGNIRDPLLLQVLPRLEESEAVPGFEADAVGDADASIANGLIKKYSGRALVIASGACAVNCRYCFRREFPYEERPLSDRDWQSIFSVLRADPSVIEVILSGGDPLMLVDQKLEWIIGQIEDIKSLATLRIHTRLPIMIPSRVTEDLIDLLVGSRLSIVVVVHCNHPNELDREVADSLRSLNDAGITLLNQSVLLRDVNDDVDTLIELSHRLVQAGCLPYYLHQLDRVTGTSHFEVAEETGIALVEQLRRALPGYAVPRYVRETPGNPSKDIIA